MASEGPPLSSYTDLDKLVASGEIAKATKAELENYAVLLCHPNRFQLAKNPKSQLEETIRTLLIVRMSEEANKEATRISKVALWVAMAALGSTLLQVFLALWP